MVQGNDGNLWVGTVSGLSKFNGIDFTNYDKNDSIAENWITASFKDREGNLWFGHWGGSITRYDRVTQQFQSIEVEKFSSFQEVSDFEEDTVRRNIIFSTKGSGVFVYDEERQTIRRFELDTGNEKSRHVQSIYLDNGGHLWMGTENDGIYVVKLLDLLNEENVKYRHLNDQNGLKGNQIRDIDEFDGEIWIATDAGVHYWPYTQNDQVLAGNGQSIIEVFDEDTELNTNDITCFEKDRHGQFWIGTRNKGVVMCVIEDDKYSFRHYSVDQGLSFYSVKELYLDRENTLWIGTDVGLNQYISDYFTLYDESVGIGNNIVLSIGASQSGDLWLGTSRGISQLMGADKTNNDSLNVGVYSIPGLSDVPVMSVFEDKDKNLWFGTATGNLFKRTPRGEFQLIDISSQFKEVIFSIAEDDEGYLWLGTRSGAARIDKKTNQLSVFTEEDGLGGNNIYKIIKDDNGTLWFAVVGGNLTSYDGNEFRQYDETDGLNHKLVLSIAKDGLGNIWLGCYTGGLYKYDGDRFINFNKDSGMKSETPYSIIADDNNNIWYGTTYGLEKYDQSQGTFEHYGKTEGFLGIQVNANSTCVDAKGNVWFGTILGAVKYNPRADFDNDVKPIIKLSERILVNLVEEDMSFDHKYPIMKNNLTFMYTGVSLNNSSRLKYKYRLLNSEAFSEWRYTKERQLAFTNLKGKNKPYQLEVHAINSDGVESDPAVYEFKITVPFYDSFWFYIIQVIIIGLMLTAAVFFGRKTGGSRLATILASIAIIIMFEYGINYLEDSLEGEIGQVVFIKVGLNAILGLILFPVEQIIKERLIKTKAAKSAE